MALRELKDEKKQTEGWETAPRDGWLTASTAGPFGQVQNNYNKFPLSRIAENPPEINIRFFPTGHWLIGMGHDRATSIQSAIGDAIFQITGKRFRDLSLQQTRSDLELKGA